MFTLHRQSPFKSITAVGSLFIGKVYTLIKGAFILFFVNQSPSVLGATITNGPGEVAIVIGGLTGGHALIFLPKLTAASFIKELNAERTQASGWRNDEEFRYRPVDCLLLVEGKQTILSDQSLIWIEQKRWRLVRIPLLKSITGAIYQGKRMK
jgi:hypothetical protein